MSRYRFIEAEQACYPIALVCRVLRVARAGYYAWRSRSLSARQRADAALTIQIVRLHRESRQTDGVPRLRAALRDAGVPVGRKRVARRFAAAAPNQLWIGDITYLL